MHSKAFDRGACNCVLCGTATANAATLCTTCAECGTELAYANALFLTECGTELAYGAPAFNPTLETSLVSTSSDGTIRVWKVDEGVSPRPPVLRVCEGVSPRTRTGRNQRQDTTFSVQFVPGGRFLVFEFGRCTETGHAAACVGSPSRHHVRY
eukprot:3086068-Rhodomonas_salina.3